MAVGTTETLVIGGERYRFRILSPGPNTPNGGYYIGCDGALTDRFHRNYIIQADRRGRPMTCSCPSCQKAERWCKHLVAVEKWWRENTPEGRDEQQRLQSWIEMKGLEVL